MFVNGINHGKKGNSMHISDDGRQLYSYGTCIAQRLQNGQFIVNASKYSVTTSRHQFHLRNALRGAQYIETSMHIPRSEYYYDLIEFIK